MRTGRSLVLTLMFLAAAAAFAATWEGTAVVGVAGDFPDQGLSAACNSFPKDSTIELRNLENGKLVRVAITGGLDNPGVFIVLSPQAGTELGMKAGVSSRIRATVVPYSSLPSPDTAAAARSTDPDFNPSLLAAGEGSPSSEATPTPEATLPSASTPDQARALASGPETQSPETPSGTQTAGASAPATEGGAPVFEPEKAKLLGDSQPLPAQTSAPEPRLAEAETKALPAPDKAVLSPEQPVSPPVAAASAPLAEASQPALAAGESPTVLGETLAPAASPGPSAPELAQASPPVIPEQDSARLLGGGAPSAPVPGPASSQLAEASAPALPQAESPALVGPLLSSPQAETESPALSDASAPALPQKESPSLLGGDQPQASPETAEAPAIAEAQPPSPATGAAAPAPSEGSAGPTEAPGGAELLSLEPAEPKPPQATSPGAAETSVPAPSPAGTEPGPEPAQALAAAPEPPPQPAPTSALRQPTLLEKLEKGSYYVQVAVFGSDRSLALAAGAFDPTWPLATQRIEGSKGEQYRLYVGPVARDESGLLILKLRSLGYGDAFLRKGQ